MVWRGRAKVEARLARAVDLPDRTVTGERDFLAVRRPRGLDRVDRRARLATEACSVDADRIDLVMAAASIAVEGEAAAVWRPRWPGADGAEPRDLTRSPLVRVHDPDLADRESRPAVVVRDELPVRRPRRIGCVSETTPEPPRRP